MKKFLHYLYRFFALIYERTPILVATMVFMVVLDMVMQVGVFTPVFLFFLFIILILEIYFFAIVKQVMHADKPHSFISFVAHLSIFTFLTIFLFGVLFARFSSVDTFLFHTVHKEVVNGFDNAIYFSGVTLFSIGYGDLVPEGFFRVVALVEGFLGSFILVSFFSLGVSQVFSDFRLRILEEQKLLQNQKNIKKDHD